MNAPAPGWNPDPTARHEYRYWDGSRWTDDVSDNGLTSVDPVDAPAGPAGLGEPTAMIDPTQQYGAQPPPGPPGPFHGAGYGSSGQLPPAQPGGAGRSTGLIVGLAALAVAAIGGITFMLTRDDGKDDETATDDASTDQPVDEPSDTTAPDDTGDDSGDDSGDAGGDGTSEDAIVDLMAAGMEEAAGGKITHDQAVCAAEGMVEEFGLDALLEMSTSGEDPFTSTDDQAAVLDVMTECIPTDVLIELGLEEAESTG